MKSSQSNISVGHIIIVSLILVSVVSATANYEYYEEEEDQTQVEEEAASEEEVASSADAAEAEAGEVAYTEAASEADVTEAVVSRQPAAAKPEVQMTDFEDFLENQTQEEPSDLLGQTQVRTAGVFGAKADTELYSSSELNHGPAFGIDYDKASLLHDSGYMRRGMDQHFGERIVANPHVRALFDRHSHLRSQSGVRLPAGFASLVTFVERYIRANSLEEAETNNGFSHRALAINVIRALFCFGNDPFMILAKMRRETNFSRRSVSPTGAVGFSQMTGIGIREVQHQLSGDASISLPAARTEYQRSVRCFSGLSNYEVPRGSTEALKDRIRERWGFDMVFGQILVKTLVSHAKASQAYANNAGGVVAAYQDAFTAYNGDTQMTPGRCTGRRSVQMREEYACDVIAQFNRMNAQWNRFVIRSTGRDLT